MLWRLKINSSSALYVGSKQIFWDSEEQVLWLDLRRYAPEFGVLGLICWDNMMFSNQSIPCYPKQLNLLHLPAHSDLRFWLSQIPAWVVESCRLFPEYQLTLLHYAGRYPQMLELLDHSPMLAWQLVKQELPEQDLVALFQSKRVHMVEKLGWHGKTETVRFLSRLRLRVVDTALLAQMEVCLLDPQRLKDLESLPRINSMALSLAARFPQLIGMRLHQSLARMPCRPMQCASMVALLEDVYRLADYLNCQDVTDQIGDCRYLVDVEKLYQAWLSQSQTHQYHDLVLKPSPNRMFTLADYTALSISQQHAWWLDFSDFESSELWAWQTEEDSVAVLFKRLSNNKVELLRVRQGINHLPSAKTQAAIELWLLQGARA